MVSELVSELVRELVSLGCLVRLLSQWVGVTSMPSLRDERLWLGGWGWGGVGVGVGDDDVEDYWQC